MGSVILAHGVGVGDAAPLLLDSSYPCYPPLNEFFQRQEVAWRGNTVLDEKLGWLSASLGEPLT